jgi:hypothetical protein
MDYRRLKVPASQRRALMGEDLYFKNFAEAKVGQIFASGYDENSGSYSGIAQFIELSLKTSDIVSYPNVVGYSNDYGWPIYDPRSESQNVIAYYKTSSSSGLSKELEKNYLKVLLSENIDNPKFLRLTVLSSREELDINAQIKFIAPIVSVYGSLNSALDIDGDNIKFASCYGSVASIEIEIE